MFVCGITRPLHETMAEPTTGHRLVAKSGTASLLEDANLKTAIWGYNGVVPGPVLRVRQDQPFTATLDNQLKDPSTVHWHGIRIDNAMDGVANLTQPPVKPGDSFTYRFRPPDAGTYWYHPHFQTWEQLARGLYGLLIVEEMDAAPKVDRELTMMFDDWRLTRDGKLHEQSFSSLHDISHMGRLGNVLTLNGKSFGKFAVKSGERLRVRLLNAATARIIAVIFEHHSPKVIALDGQPVEPFAPPKNMILLAPAQRADVVLDCTQEPGTTSPILVDVGRRRLSVAEIVYHPHQRQRPKPLGEPLVLPANPMPDRLDLDKAVKVDLDMGGGAMTRMRSITYKGKQYDLVQLARSKQKLWAFNGVAGMPDKPLVRLTKGQTVTVRMVNNTAWPHAMHFHGHHVREIAHSRRPARAHWRDTIFIERGDVITVAFQASNPGRWMLHCHMLAHQRGGMSTWYEVS